MSRRRDGSEERRKHDLTFDAWVEEKEAVLEEAQAAVDEAKERAAAELQRKRSLSAAAFDAWVREKNLHERVLQLLEKLSPAHGKTEEKWREVGLALAHAHALLEESRITASATEREASAAVASMAKRRSAAAAFVQWSKRNYGFDEVLLKPDAAAQFSRGARAMMDKKEGGAYAISGLTFTKDGSSMKSSGIVRPPSKDETLRNALFVSSTRAVWKELLRTAIESVNAATGTQPPKPVSVAAVSTATAAAPPAAQTAEVQAKRRAAFIRGGVNKLAAMVDEDRRKREDDERDALVEKREDAKHTHTRWVRTKDSTRIRVPLVEETAAARFREPTHPRMDFTIGAGSGRVPVSRPPLATSTADIIRRAGMGLKFAHPIGTASANNADLRKSRKSLLSQGFVFRQNFADPETGTLDDSAHDAFVAAMAAAERRAAAARARDEDAFDRWASGKEGADLARETMTLIPIASGYDGAEVGSDAHVALWRAIGYACKAIDRALLNEWQDWSAPLVSRRDCARAWEGFRPSAAPASLHSDSKARSSSPAARAAEADRDFTPADAASAVKLLRQLSAEHRRAAAARFESMRETSPTAPVLQRIHEVEALPQYIWGHEEVIACAAGELGVSDGHGVRMFHSSGVGAELVLRWACGAASLPAGEDSQPPYVIVLETCGVAGGTAQRAGLWTRVLVDPPEAKHVLSSAPGSTHVPLSIAAQGVWDVDPAVLPLTDAFVTASDTMIGGVRLTGLQPHTAYCYRVRAYNRVGVSTYTFGMFMTAAAPPPAPVLATITAAPISLLSAADAAEMRAQAGLAACASTSVRLCWDRSVGRRAMLRRLARVYALATAETVSLIDAERSAHGEVSGDLSTVVPGECEWSILIRNINREVGLRESLQTCIAAVDAWPLREEYRGETQELGIITRQPCSVWDALSALKLTSVGLRDVLALAAHDDVGATGVETDASLMLMTAAPPSPASTSTRSPRPQSADASPALTTTRMHASRASTPSRGRGSMTSRDHAVSDVSNSIVAPRSRPAASKNALLQCVHDGDDGMEWREVYVGMRSTRVVDTLTSGTAYAFRAQIVNADGVASALGPPAIIHTALPSPAQVACATVHSPTSVTLKWGTAAPAAPQSAGGVPSTAAAALSVRPSVASTAHSDVDSVLKTLHARSRGSRSSTTVASGNPTGLALAKIMASTRDAASPATSARTPRVTVCDGGVGVQLHRVWAKYDVRGAGFIERAELRGVLEDLGVCVDSVSTHAMASALGLIDAPTTKLEEDPALPRLELAFQLLDADESGRVSFDAFRDWWNGVDAARAAARAYVASAAHARSRARSRGSARSKSPGGGAETLPSPASSTDVAEDTSDPRDDIHTSAVLYLLEGRRRRREFDVEEEEDGGSGVFTAWEPLGMCVRATKRVRDMLPNSEYQFRVLALGRHALGAASKPCTIVTLPLAPFAPVLIRAGARTLALRWYPGELGAARFDVQMKKVDAILPAGATLHGPRAGGTHVGASAAAAARSAYYTGRNVSQVHGRALMTRTRVSDPDGMREEDVELWAEDVHGATWNTVYSGTFTHTVIAGLTSNAVYRLRVVAVNAAGARSRPSPETQVITGDVGDAGILKASNASVCFTVEVGRFVTGVLDIVTGDTLCFTEDLYVDGDAPIARSGAGQRRGLPPLVEASHPRAVRLGCRTLAATVLSDDASAMCKADSAGVGMAVHADAAAAAAARMLSAQVEWCAITPDAACVWGADEALLATIRVPQGAIIKRSAASLAPLDVYRMPWADEAGRWTLREELAATFHEDEDASEAEVPEGRA